MKFMEYALEEAKISFEKDEIPVGCVIVKDGVVIAKAHNTCEEEKNPLCHAEMNAINIALTKLNQKFLDGCEMYVTLEPCAMCSGAIINSRIKRLYIGSPEPKTGCCGSAKNLFDGKLANSTEVYIGINEDECKSLMQNFFKIKR